MYPSIALRGVARIMLQVAPLFLSLAPLALGATAPCTLYKPQDIENARENARRFPWAREIVKTWERSVEFAMTQDRAFFERMVPELTNWSEFGQNCPACVGRKSAMGECFIYQWTVTDPDKLVCKYCKTVYPNPEYPETGVMDCPRMGQRFTYYQTPEERAHPGENPSKYAFRWASWPVHTSFSGVIRSKKGHWCAAQVFPLAKLYALTGNVAYAERCGWILARFAQCYPTWLYHSYNGTVADCPPAEAASNLGKHGRGGRFPKAVIIDPFERHQSAEFATLCNGFWGADRFDCSGCSPYLFHMTVAYDLIRGANYPDGRPVLDPATEQRIVNDLLLAGCTDMENWNDINNKCGPSRSLSGAVGMLFHRPLSARRALAGFETLLDDCFHFDGFCKESPSYADMHLGLLREIPEVLRGYTDPVGWRPPDGHRLVDLNPFESVVRYRLALESMVRLLAPGRRYPVIGDTHFGAGINSEYAEILTDRYSPEYAGLLQEALGAKLADRGSEYALWYRRPELQTPATVQLPLRSEWFPGWHVAVMRGGDPYGGTALYLNAYGNDPAQHMGHRHADTLGLIYYAFGRELASDRGYIWDDVTRQTWTSSTLAHNVVTVDGANQQAKRGSVLDLFGASPVCEVTQVHANAYAQCDLYRRTTVLVRLPGGLTYAVDVFSVSGGQRHQYGFQCNGALVRTTGPALQPVGDTVKWLTNLRASQPSAPFTATWQLDDLCMDLTVLSPIQRLLVTDVPGWRSEKGSELNAPSIQQVFAERRADTGTLRSDYVAIMAPYQGVSPVKSAHLLPEASADAVGIVVELADRTDYILLAPDQVPRRFGPVALAGRFGFVSTTAEGSVCQAYLLNGTRLECGGTRLTLPQPSRTVKVASVSGPTLRLAERLAAADATRGTVLLAGDTGYEVETVSDEGLVVRDYPAAACSEVTLIHSTYVGKLE